MAFRFAARLALAAALFPVLNSAARAQDDPSAFLPDHTDTGGGISGSQPCAQARQQNGAHPSPVVPCGTLRTTRSPSHPGLDLLPLPARQACRGRQDHSPL